MAAAMVGLALLGQVVCLGFDMCASSPPVDDEAPAVETVAEEPPPACELPICGPLGARLYCIEGFESRHNGSAVNPTSGARGYLQWLPGTARQWSVVIGDRWSEWMAAARIAARGEWFFTSQWVPLQRGLC